MSNLKPPEEESSIIVLDDEDDSETTATTISTTSITSQDETALVYLRLRPVKNESFCSNYSISSNVLITKQPESSKAVKNLVEKHFTFTDVFDGNVDQNTVYENCVRRNIQSEENLTVLTYGTSGSGKTFTLLGNFDLCLQLNVIIKLYISW